MVGTRKSPCCGTVHTGCIPYADCDPLHSCVLYPVCAVYFAHATHFACATYAACYTYTSRSWYAAYALYIFFQLILMIQYSKSDFSLLLVLVMSPLSLRTILCMHAFTHKYVKLCSNNALTGKQYARKVCDIKVTCFSLCNMTLKDKIKLPIINV